MVHDQLDSFDFVKDNCSRLCSFFFNVLPYVSLAFLGHTSASLVDHGKDWSWSIYLVSCLSTIVLGVATYFIVQALGIPQQIGYAFAVLLGRNVDESLDLFSHGVVASIKRVFRRDL